MSCQSNTDVPDKPEQLDPPIVYANYYQAEGNIGFEVVELDSASRKTLSSLKIKQKNNRLQFKLNLSVPEDFDYPELNVNDGFGMSNLVPARGLIVRIMGKDSLEENSISTYNLYDELQLKADSINGQTIIDLGLEDFENLSPGTHELTLQIQAEWATNIGEGSGVYRFLATIKCKVSVDPIYRSTVYFQSLKLNKEKVKDLLGNNDFYDGTPEASISIWYGNENLIHAYARNSFDLFADAQKVFYHTEPDVELAFYVLDEDYGPNPSDGLGYKLIPIKDLMFETYRNISFPMTDEFIVYCTSDGQIN